MSQLINMDSEYKTWVESLSRRFKQSQIKAAVKVNRELLTFYWSIGKDIVEMKAESRWGSGFMETLSKDLQAELPMAKGLSSTNLRYIKRFYVLYSPLFQAQSVPELAGPSIRAQVVPEIVPSVEGQMDNSIIFDIPWGHHRNILIKCQDNLAKALFYVQQTVQNNWSRAMLLNFLDTDLYERQGKAITNFKSTLPTIEEIENELKG